MHLKCEKSELRNISEKTGRKMYCEYIADLRGKRYYVKKESNLKQYLYIYIIYSDGWFKWEMCIEVLFYWSCTKDVENHGFLQLDETHGTVVCFYTLCNLLFYSRYALSKMLDKMLIANKIVNFLWILIKYMKRSLKFWKRKEKSLTEAWNNYIIWKCIIVNWYVFRISEKL